MSKRSVLLAFFLLLILFLSLFALPQPGPDKLKIYISADIEGIGGVVSRMQTSWEGEEYQRFRRFMTQEVNAAIEGAFSVGATEVVVSDSHGSGQNILIEELNKEVKLIRDWPRPLIMMEGIDETFDAVFLIGYHAKEGSKDATLAHSMSGSRIFDIKLNGISVPEAGFNAAIAGHFGVPVVLISGDQTIVSQAKELLGDVEGVVVKEGIGTIAKTIHPEKTQKLIKEGAIRALRRLKEFQPLKLQTPITLEITFKDEVYASLVGMLPGVKQLDGRTISFTGKDMVVVSKFLSAILFL